MERCIRTLKEEWLDPSVLYSIFHAQKALEGFVHYHNHECPHQGRACKNRTPDEAFPVLPTLAHLPETVDPDAWVSHYHKRQYRRRITSDGTIQIDKHTYYIDEKRAKRQVVVLLDAEAKCFHVWCDDVFVKSLPLRGLRNEEMNFQSYLIWMKQEARS